MAVLCGKCRAEMSHVSIDYDNPSRTVGICPTHGVMYANPYEYGDPSSRPRGSI